MSTLNKELLSILVCPENKTPLELADATLLQQLNQRIAAGKLVNRGGETVEEPISCGLVRQDGQLLYIVRDAIPVMLVDQAVPLDQLAS